MTSSSEKACCWKEGTQFLGRQEQACWPVSGFDGDGGACPLSGGVSFGVSKGHTRHNLSDLPNLNLKQASNLMVFFYKFYKLCFLFHSSRTVTSWYQGVGYCCTGLTMVLIGRIWNTWGFGTRKAIGHFKQGLMGHRSRNVEDS